MLRSLAFVSLLCATAHADEQEPRKFWLGASGGIGLVQVPNDDPTFSDYDDSLLLGLGGIDIGISKMFGGANIQIDAKGYPQGGMYKGRAALLVGSGFDIKYRIPCAAPPGMTCNLIYNYRDVKSVAGLKLAANYLRIPGRDDLTYGEVGLALHSQFLIDASFAFDPVTRSPGYAFDFSYQVGPVYIGYDMFGIFTEHAIPLVALFHLGFAVPMW